MVSFLKNTHFKNPIGEKVNLNHEEELDIEYDIHHTIDFLPNLGLKVKIGTFSKNLPHGRQLYMLKEMIEWNTDHRQVCLIYL